MSGLAAVTITLGVLIIVSRGSLVLFPKRTLDFTRRLVDRPSVIRLIGVFLALLGLMMIVTASGDDRAAAQFVLGTGWFFLAVSMALLVFFPSLYRGLTVTLLDVMEGGGGTRALGVLGVAVGIVFVYLGSFVL